MKVLVKKKQKKFKKQEVERSVRERAVFELSMMKHKDLVKACVERGIEFEKIIEFTHPAIAEWFLDNYENGIDPNLLNEYDAWLKPQLEARGYIRGDAIMSPALRLGYNPDINTIPETSLFKPTKKEKKDVQDKPEEKPKVEKDAETGVKKGTKKNLTYTLTKKGLEFSEIESQVKSVFPDADSKSIKIWMRRCQKGS